MSISGLGGILSAIEDRMRKNGHDEKDIRRFRGLSLARCAMALPLTSIDRRLSLADAALRSTDINVENGTAGTDI